MATHKILITSALPYANGPLHFGHIAGAYLPADCCARFHRLMGDDVLYLCGSDEYGIAITISAELAHRSPQEHVDIYHSINQAFFKKLALSFDHYSRTTWAGHVETVQAFFNDLLKNGYIEEKITSQLYSEKEKKFLADRYVMGTCPKCGYPEARGDECQKCGASYEAVDLKHPLSKITKAPLILRNTKHWFLLFDKFKEALSDWIATKNWKPNVLNFAKSYIDELRPRAITRDSEWGIPLPLPHTEGKVFYVWFDAPIGYISAAKEWALETGDKAAWKKYFFDADTQWLQFIGKDNIPFHAVFFPAMILGQNDPYKMVDQLPANEFLNLEGKQFSKSDGWTIDLERFFTQFTTDQIRYYLAANAPETHDAEFTWKDFGLHCNGDLVGKFGNLANRTLVFAQKHCEGKIPALKSLEEIDQNFLQNIKERVSAIQAAYASFHLRKATQLAMELATLGNVYFDGKKPWAKTTSLASLQVTVAACIECLKALALVFSPLCPESAQKLWTLLGFTTQLEKQNWKKIMDTPVKAGTVLPIPETLFKKIEEEVIAKEEELLQKNLPKAPAEPSSYKEEIGFEDFQKVDLRVAKVLEVEPVAKSKKLLKFLVDLGGETRTIVSGIAQSYPDLKLLVGKHIIVVANLKTAKLMGIDSQGMILSAIVEGQPKLLEAPHAQAGDAVN